LAQGEIWQEYSSHKYASNDKSGIFDLTQRFEDGNEIISCRMVYSSVCQFLIYSTFLLVS